MVYYLPHGGPLPLIEAVLGADSGRSTRATSSTGKSATSSINRSTSHASSPSSPGQKWYCFLIRHSLAPPVNLLDMMVAGVSPPDTTPRANSPLGTSTPLPTRRRHQRRPSATPRPSTLGRRRAPTAGGTVNITGTVSGPTHRSVAQADRRTAFCAHRERVPLSCRHGHILLLLRAGPLTSVVEFLSPARSGSTSPQPVPG